MDASEAQQPEHEPKHDRDTELAVLGAMMQSRTATRDVNELLSANDFYITAHQQLFNACVNALDRHDDLDIITVAEELRRVGKLDALGGITQLGEIAQTVPSTAHARTHASIVREHSNLRKLADIGARALRDGQQSQSFDEAVSGFKKDVDELYAFDNETQQVLSIADATEATMSFIDEIEKSDGGLMGIPSGITLLDHMTRGWQDQRFYIFAARPGMGKSAIALQFALHAAHQGHSVLFHSLEMSHTEVVMRLLSAEGRVDNERMQGGTLEQVDWDKLSEAAARLSGLSLFIDDDPSPTMATIERRAERMKDSNGLDLIFVDYLQLVTGSTSGRSSRQEDVGGISRDMKVLAKNLDLPVIALAQLSREVEKRPNKRPRLGDLRESGSLEQDADFVGFFYRDEHYHPDSPDAGTVEIINRKNRGGRTGQLVRAAWMPHISSIGNMANETLQPPPEDDDF